MARINCITHSLYRRALLLFKSEVTPLTVKKSGNIRIQRCGMIAAAITIQQCLNGVEVSNIRQDTAFNNEKTPDCVVCF